MTKRATFKCKLSDRRYPERGSPDAIGPNAPRQISDLLLPTLVAIATAQPPGEVKIELPNSTPNARFDTIKAVLSAMQWKYFHASDSRKPKNARAVARELVIDILANRPTWSYYDNRIAALILDKVFLERVALGLARKRKPIFDADEWWLLLNWHEWSQRFDAFEKQNVPPLKFWTREAICNLMGSAFEDGEIKLSRLDSRLRRLALDKQSVKPAKVISCIHDAGEFRIETV